MAIDRYEIGGSPLHPLKQLEPSGSESHWRAASRNSRGCVGLQHFLTRIGLRRVCPSDNMCFPGALRKEATTRAFICLLFDMAQDRASHAVAWIPVIVVMVLIVEAVTVAGLYFIIDQRSILRDPAVFMMQAKPEATNECGPLRWLACFVLQDGESEE